MNNELGIFLKIDCNLIDILEHIEGGEELLNNLTTDDRSKLITLSKAIELLIIKLSNNVINARKDKYDMACGHSHVMPNFTKIL